MTIHGWGSPLWNSEITAEFGDPGNRPIWLSQFYRGGGRVPNIAQNNAISTAGAIQHSMFYGTVLYQPGSAAWGAGTYYLTVPAGVNTVYVDHLLGGGGGGSGGSDGGYNHRGPGGYGGYAGGYWNGAISVNPGDTLTIVVGGGGAGGLSQCYAGYAGNPGGSTAIYRNGSLVASVGGGGGGIANIQDNNGASCGGMYGQTIQYTTPIDDGMGGYTCPSGYTYDGSNCYQYVGGTAYGPYPGAGSALGAGGGAGGYNSPGGAGGWGAGGGGGGCMIGSCVNASTGGAGGSGYAAIHW